MSVFNQLIQNQAVLLNKKDNTTAQAMKFLGWELGNFSDDGVPYDSWDHLLHSSEYFFADGNYNGDIPIDDLPQIEPQDVLKENQITSYEQLKNAYNENYVVILRSYTENNIYTGWEYTAVCQEFSKRKIEGLYTAGWTTDLSKLPQIIKEGVRRHVASTVFDPDFEEQWVIKNQIYLYAVIPSKAELKTKLKNICL
jgi:hypothetical protein